MLIAIVLRGDRGLEQDTIDFAHNLVKIAIVLRGDRGLEQAQKKARLDRQDCDRSSGRSRIGTWVDKGTTLLR